MEDLLKRRGFWWDYGLYGVGVRVKVGVGVGGASRNGKAEAIALRHCPMMSGALQARELLLAAMASVAR